MSFCYYFLCNSTSLKVLCWDLSEWRKTDLKKWIEKSVCIQFFLMTTSNYREKSYFDFLWRDPVNLRPDPQICIRVFFALLAYISFHYRSPEVELGIWIRTLSQKDGSGLGFLSSSLRVRFSLRVSSGQPCTRSADVYSSFFLSF